MTLGHVLLAAAILGLLVRGRARLCWSFLVYLTAVGIGDALTLMWPQRFWTQEWWIVFQATYAILRILVAMEIAFRAFSAFPRARFHALLLLVLVGSLTAFAVARPLPDAYVFRAVFERAEPLLYVGSLWAFVLILLTRTWYHIPLHPFHRDVLIAFVLYLGVQAAVQAAADPAVDRLAAILLPALYGAAEGVWAWCAWRPTHQPAASPATMRALQPWAQW